ncbi:hypothetical protein MNBD_GAMMA16-530 [hydrothermal vent metagenome]|uniref:HDOD domain-containing protein n=1 Tax=hydrothermal vent metagenome TaxID=652676 RepID=A0A3B0Z8R0_9ZZZZ
MVATIESIVSESNKLISFPGVAIKVNSMVNDPAVTAKDIGKVISQDPGMTAALLKVVNSPFFGFSREVDTISRAVTLLGGKQVRDLTLAASAANAFKGIPNELLSMDDFWYHSLCCALVAQELADLSKVKKTESVFIAGLLHDIGQLAIFNNQPELAKKSLSLVLDSPGELELYEAEQQIMGFDHAQVGQALALSWGFPESLLTCIAFHHEVSVASNYQTEVAITHIANSIACLIEINSTHLDDAPPIDALAWEATGLNEDVVTVVVEAARGKIKELQSALSLSA